LLERNDVEMLEQIGQGGMGVVFRGIRKDTRETIAIKMLGSRFASRPQFALRFEREVALMAKPSSAIVRSSSVTSGTIPIQRPASSSSSWST